MDKSVFKLITMGTVFCLLTTLGLQAAVEPQVILCLGDSLTAGYGLELEEAYPALLQEKIDALGLPFKVINGGLSGETSAGGLRRIDWMLRRPVDILVLALGANDGLRGLEVAATHRNLQAIIDRASRKYPKIKIVIAGMKAPPNMGREFTENFAAIYPELARTNDALLIPFLLESVAAEPSLNLADGMHPNPAGHKIIAETLWRHLKPLLAQ